MSKPMSGGRAPPFLKDAQMVFSAPDTRLGIAHTLRSTSVAVACTGAGWPNCRAMVGTAQGTIVVSIEKEGRAHNAYYLSAFPTGYNFGTAYASASGRSTGVASFLSTRTTSPACEAGGVSVQDWAPVFSPRNDTHVNDIPINLQCIESLPITVTPNKGNYFFISAGDPLFLKLEFLPAQTYKKNCFH